jgi:hypothetical protein
MSLRDGRIHTLRGIPFFSIKWSRFCSKRYMSNRSIVLETDMVARILDLEY